MTIINADDARYLAAVYAKLRDFEVARYLTTVCPECEGDGVGLDAEHVTSDDGGFVLIGCEGYHVVNPNLLGLDAPNWTDWTVWVDGPEDEGVERHN